MVVELYSAVQSYGRTKLEVLWGPSSTRSWTIEDILELIGFSYHDAS
jgi:S-formylglutathione hydrolase FrmB